MSITNEININKVYGKRIFEQEIGTEVGKIISKSKTKIMLNFEFVESVNTAFWNALISEIIKENDKSKPSDLFSVKHANTSIKSTLAISLMLLEYYEQE